MGFEELELSSPILDYLNSIGFTAPTEIQKISIPPLICDYHDVVVQAETGSGKTLCYLLPLIELFIRSDLRDVEFGSRFSVFSIIISPTRELALQIHTTLNDLCKYIFPKSSAKSLLPVLLKGGKSVSKERALIDAVSKLQHVGVIVSTPGKLSHLLTMIENWSFKHLKLFVIDEADRLMEMKFDVELESILKHLPKQRKNAVYSATISSLSERLYRIGFKDWKLFSISSDNKNSIVSNAVMNNLTKISNEFEKTPSRLLNYYTFVKMPDKFEALKNFFSHLLCTKSKKAIVFFLTCDFVEHVYRTLTMLQPNCRLLKIHRKMAQKDREIAFKQFREASSELMILLSTDLFSRGIDIQDVDWIFQFDAPQDPTLYLHRCGRTARGGKDGCSLILLDSTEDTFVEFIKSRNVDLTELPSDYLKCEISPFKQEIKTTIPSLLRSIAEKDRDFMLSGNKAFVSFVRGYSEHRLKYTFNISQCDLGGLATLMGLLRVPRVKEILGKRLNFIPSSVDPQTVPFTDPEKEKKRLEEEVTLKSERVEIKTPKKQSKKKKEKQKQKRTRADKRIAKKREIDNDWLELSREESLAKKVKRGKLSKEKFNEMILSPFVKSNT